MSGGLHDPEGFQQTESLRDPHPDHVGIRLGFVSDELGRELHFAGILVEFGEGLPSAGVVTVAQGLEGPLQGGRRTWVLSWHALARAARGRCSAPLTARGVLQTLERAAIIPAQ